MFVFRYRANFEKLTLGGNGSGSISPQPSNLSKSRGDKEGINPEKPGPEDPGMIEIESVEVAVIRRKQQTSLRSTSVVSCPIQIAIAAFKRSLIALFNDVFV
jgi:hypothetical protein